MKQPNQSPRHILWLKSFLLVLLLAHIYYTFALGSPSFHSSDETVYTLMAVNFAQGNGIYIRNGAEEMQSLLLHFNFPFFHPNNAGRLVTQYPPLYPLMASPFYALFGLMGITYFNAFLYVLTVCLVWRLAQLLFRDEDLSFAAVLIYIFGTFSWLYSQTTLSHVSANFFSLLAVHFMCRYYFSQGPKKNQKKDLLLSGFVLGIGFACRFDSIFLIPMLLYPATFRKKKLQLKEAALLLGGFMPWAGCMAGVNFIKFGTFNPLSYGYLHYSRVLHTEFYVLPIILWGIAFLSLYLTRKHEKLWKRRRGDFLFSFLALLVGGAFLAASMSKNSALPFFAIIFGDAYHFLVFDGDPAYFNGFIERSFFLTMPFLPALLLFLRERVTLPFETFFAAIFTYLLFFTLLGDKGWITPHPRYLYPILPYISILCAYLWRYRKAPLSGWLLLALGFLAINIFLLRTHDFRWVGRDGWVLGIPAAIGLVTLGAAILCLTGRITMLKRQVLAAAAFFGMAWSAVVYITYDAAIMLEGRASVIFAQHTQLAQRLPPQSVVITDSKGNEFVPFYLALPEGRVGTIPDLLQTQGQHLLVPFLRHYLLEAPRPVYIKMRYFKDMQLEARGLKLEAPASLRVGGAQFGRLEVVDPSRLTDEPYQGFHFP